MKRLVIVESPFAAPTIRGRRQNERYARACVRDALNRGDTPLASHLLYTQLGILDDDVFTDRELGLLAGHAWYRVAEAAVVYVDRGVSTGMVAGIAAARANGVAVEYRTIGSQWSDAPQHLAKGE